MILPFEQSEYSEVSGLKAVARQGVQRPPANGRFLWTLVVSCG